MKNNSKSYEIALSSIACAFSVISLTLGSYVTSLLAAGYLIAIFALMLPLAKGFWRGGALAFLAASVLAVLFNLGGALKLIPFIGFLGIHPLINYLQNRFVKNKLYNVLMCLGKALWFDGVLIFCWFVLSPLFGLTELSFYPVLEKYLWYFIFVGGTVLFLVYDVMIYFCQRSMNVIVGRIGGHK